MVEEGEEQFRPPAHAADTLAALRRGIGELVAAELAS